MFPPIDVYCERAFDELAAGEGGKEIQEGLKSLPKLNVSRFLAHENLYIKSCGAESDKSPNMDKKTCLVWRQLSAEQVFKACLSLLLIQLE